MKEAGYMYKCHLFFRTSDQIDRMVINNVKRLDIGEVSIYVHLQWYLQSIHNRVTHNSASDNKRVGLSEQAQALIVTEANHKKTGYRS